MFINDENETNIPLLKATADNEKETMHHKATEIINQITEISNDIDAIYRGDTTQTSNVIDIKSKTELLEKKMKTFYQRCNKTNHNYYYNEHEFNSIYSNIYDKYNELNMKMNFVFKQVQKGNLGEDYVKELQKEYKTINDTTRKLKKISNDIKSLSEGQSDKVRDINQQIESIEDVVYRTNKEVEMFNTKERNKVSHYGWGVLVLIILVVTLIGYIWFKVNYNK